MKTYDTLTGDLGAIIIAVRQALPTAKLPAFEDALLRAAYSACTSDSFRRAIGVAPRDEPPGPRKKFNLITGGAA
jgi:hypothetical protein